MDAKVFYGRVNAQEVYTPEMRKELEELMLRPAFLAGVKAALQSLETERAGLSTTLPTPEVVLQIAHTQGRIKGAYEVLDNLVNLTVKEEADATRSE